MKKFIIGAMAMFAAMSATAADFAVSGGADFVSNYVWRGMDQADGASIQPSLGISYGGLSLGAWGSSPLSFENGGEELDFSLAYEVGGFSVMVTDYWYVGNTAPIFGEKSGHIYEGSLGYTISEKFPLAIGVNVMFAGTGDQKNGDQNYTTYISVAYPFSVGDVDCSATVGMTPNGSIQYGAANDKFGICNVAFRADYGIKITDSFSLPIFAEVSTNPILSDYAPADGYNGVNAVFGLSLGF